MDNPNAEMTLYEVAQYKKVQPATVKAAVKSGRLPVAREAPVGKTRTLSMFLRSEVEAWQPRETGSSVKKAAKTLGLDEGVAETLRARYLASGRTNKIEIVEG